VKKYHSYPEGLAAMIINMASHYANVHSECDHTSNFIADYTPITDPDQKKRFIEILQYYSERAENFNPGRLSNTEESMNRMTLMNRKITLQQ